MATLRLDFHIGRVEWVTCQVPWRKEGGGGSKVLLGGGVELEVLDGARKRRGGSWLGGVGSTGSDIARYSGGEGGGVRSCAARGGRIVWKGTEVPGWIDNETREREIRRVFLLRAVSRPRLGPELTAWGVSRSKLILQST